MSSPLSFEENCMPSDFAELSVNGEECLVNVFNILCDESERGNNYSAFVGRYQHKIVLVAPYFHQSHGLPIRLGEKVFFRIKLSSMRFLPLAQKGVNSNEYAFAFLNWLSFRYPKITLVFTDLMTDSPLYLAISSSEIDRYRLINNYPAPHLFHVFKGSYEHFFQEKSSKYKNQLRKKEKIFRERFGTVFSFEEYRKSDDVQPFFDAASVINKKTYQNKLFGETVDNSSETIQLHLEFATQGTFRSFILWHKAIPLCFILGYQGKDGTFQHQKTGFDPEWRDCSPGIYCNILMLQRLYEIDRPKILDFGSGDADYKRLFANSFYLIQFLRHL